MQGRDNTLNIAGQGRDPNRKPPDPAEIQRLYDAGMTLYARGTADDLRQAMAVFQQILAVDPGNLKVAVAVNKIGASSVSGRASWNSPVPG